MVCASARKGLEPVVLTLLRISTGIIMAGHGWQKAQDIPGWINTVTGMGVPFPKIMAYLALAGELGGGLGLIVGLLTPLAAVGVVAVMATAVVKVHWANGLWAKDNGFEYPLTLLMIGIYFMIRGGGPISLDHLFCRKKDTASM